MRIRTLHGVVLTLACALPLAACEAVLGLGNLSESGSGNVGGSDSATSDGPGSTDAAPGTDAGGDVRGDVAADDGTSGGGTSPCAVADAHTICEDFDEIDAASALGARWALTAGVGGALTLAGASIVPPVSPPNSLGVEVDPLEGGIVTLDLLDTLTEPSVTSVRCEMEMWIDHVDPGESTYFLGVAVRGGGVDPVTESGLNLSLDPDLNIGLTSFAFYRDGGISGTTAALGAGLYGQWFHVTLQVAQPQGGVSNASASIGFQEGGSGSGSLAVDVPTSATAALITIGYTQGTRSTSAGWLYYVDNFFCDVAR